jgi:hypothetical protein
VDKGFYSFQAGAPLQAPDDSQIFLRTSRKDALVDILRIVKALSQDIVLTFQKDAVYCALSDSQGHMAVHVKIEADLF